MMYVHLSEDVVVPVRDIMVILNLEPVPPPEGEGMEVPETPYTTVVDVSSLRVPTEVRDVSGGQPKSAVITDSVIYLSSLSSATLLRRCLLFGGDGYITLA